MERKKIGMKISLQISLNRETEWNFVQIKKLSLNSQHDIKSFSKWIEDDLYTDTQIYIWPYRDCNQYKVLLWYASSCMEMLSKQKHKT